MIADRHRLGQFLKRSKNMADPSTLEGFQRQLQLSIQKAQQRLQVKPTIDFDPFLPVTQLLPDLRSSLLSNSVLVVAGETGSGKTTQIPKLCLSLGLGIYGKIGHTQPRRIAVRNVAERLSQELNLSLGEGVGYQMRFEDKSSHSSLIKVMTDGILLAETQRDPFLNQYDCIIVDEAHERSLNIDFLLGYLKGLLKKRRDLKVIVTSATIDVERVSKFFDGAPIIEVSGRTYPVDLWYRPLQSEKDEQGELLWDDDSVDDAILDVIKQLTVHEIDTHQLPGDVLVFLAGEREIRDCADHIRKAQIPHTHVLPLYARLSPTEQKKIFEPMTGRKIVLSTNVAETSLTVPGIRYVIDTGMARVSRYSVRSKVQRLPIEPISQASANQRKGRCGRVEPGICIRLYGEDDFLNRATFTDPEIKRTHLGAVILKMLSMRLGDVSQFEFLDPPDSRAIQDGYLHLKEIKVLDDQHRLTPLGLQVARLPIDPRMGAMLLAASKLDCLHEALVIVSALASQDPRERPIHKQQAADQAHGQWKDKQSDLITWLNLWNAIEEAREQLNKSAFQKWCRQNFLNSTRLREWRELHRQLKMSVHSLQLKVNNEPSNYLAIHQALLHGLLNGVGHKHQEGGYSGTRQRRFYAHPSSALVKSKAPWIMCASLIETQRLYGHGLAQIEPEWIIQIASHLLKHQYSEPHWHKKRGQVTAYDQISLYGLILAAKQPVNFANINSITARSIFIREALVRGDMQSQALCILHNRELLDTWDSIEAKTRRRDLIIDEEALYQFYDRLLPEHICQTTSFERWYRETSKTQPQLLCLTDSDILVDPESLPSLDLLPNHLMIDHLKLPLSYCFDPTDEADGVTITMPEMLLGQVNVHVLDWLVPGMIEEKCVALIRGLPKSLRKNFVPVPDFVKAALATMTYGQGNLCEVLGLELTRMTGVKIDHEAWQVAISSLDPHWQFRIAITDAEGKIIKVERGLNPLKKGHVSSNITSDQSKTHQQGFFYGEHIEVLDHFDIPHSIEAEVNGVHAIFFPALVYDGSQWQQKNFATAIEAEYHHRWAVSSWLLNKHVKSLKSGTALIKSDFSLAMLYASTGNLSELIEDLSWAAWMHVLQQNHEVVPRTSNQAEHFLERHLSTWIEWIRKGIDTLNQSLPLALDLKKQLKGKINLAWVIPLNDLTQQLQSLIYPHFIRYTPWMQLMELPRYLKGMLMRMEKLPNQLTKDQAHTHEITQWIQTFEEIYPWSMKDGFYPEDARAFRWLIEEYRVSVFAQSLGTKETISAKRIDKAWAALKQGKH